MKSQDFRLPYLHSILKVQHSLIQHIKSFAMLIEALDSYNLINSHSMNNNQMLLSYLFSLSEFRIILFKKIQLFEKPTSNNDENAEEINFFILQDQLFLELKHEVQQIISSNLPVSTYQYHNLTTSHGLKKNIVNFTNISQSPSIQVKEAPPNPPWLSSKIKTTPWIGPRK